MRFILAMLALSLLGGGAFACLYAYLSFTDPKFRNPHHGYVYTCVGLAALCAFVALWIGLR